MSRTNTRKTIRRAFSLIELMLVIAIIGALMGIATFALVGQGERAKKRATEASMQTVGTALRQFKLDNNEFPPTLQELVAGQYIQSVPTDGWDRPFYYATLDNGSRFALISTGPDGQSGTPDDIDAATVID